MKKLMICLFILFTGVSVYANDCNSITVMSKVIDLENAVDKQSEDALHILSYGISNVNTVANYIRGWEGRKVRIARPSVATDLDTIVDSFDYFFSKIKKRRIKLELELKKMRTYLSECLAEQT